MVDAPIDRQVSALELVLTGSEVTSTILERAPRLGLPHWYLGAGAVAGSVWNLLHGFDPRHGITDFDLVYFDSEDVTAEAEASNERRANEIFADLGVRLDVKNEARVHVWYAARFGRSIPPYGSTEQAISTWPTTASSVGVRHDDGGFVVCAPFGLRDLFAMVVRPNKAIIDQGIYEAKASRWAGEWPRLHVLPWQHP